MIGRWILRLIPWWLYGLAAVLMAPMALGSVGESWQRLQEIDRARAAQPPAEIRLAAQSPLPGAGVPLGEMQVNGRLVALGRYGGEDGRVYALIGPAKAGDGPHVALLWSAKTPVEEVRADMARAFGEGGLHTVRAFILDPVPQSAVLVSALVAQGAQINGPLIVARPWFGTRAEALRAETFTAVTATLLLLTFTLGFAVAALVKFRAWRRRRAVARPTAVSATARPVVTRQGKAGSASAKPAGARPAAANSAAARQAAPKPSAPPPVRAADPYAKSPIISARRGWLS